MKTNKFFKLLPETMCFCLLMGAVFSGYSQGYASFFGSESTRYHIFLPLTVKSFAASSAINLLGPGDTFEFKTTKNDTITIRNKLYFKSQNFGGLFLREDTVAGQLFCYYGDVNEEFLVCDMSLSVGDTFVFPIIDHRDYYYWEEGENTVVDSIAYIDGKKILYFSPLAQSIYYSYEHYTSYFLLTFTEGIGATYGPFGYVRVSQEPYLGIMLCVDKNDTLAYMTSDTLGCYQNATSLKETELTKLQLYPNPATTALYLDFGDEPYHPPFMIHIIDLFGKVVWQSTITSLDQPIPVRHLPPGMYILQCRSGQKTFRNKFIKR